LNEPQPSVSIGLAGFIRYLAAHEFNVGHSDALIALQLFATTSPPAMAKARDKLRILLCRNQQQWNSFDLLFNAYWQNSDERFSVFEPIPAREPGSAANSQWQPELIETTSAFTGEEEDDDSTDSDTESSTQAPVLDNQAEYQIAEPEYLTSSLEEHYARVDLRHVVEASEIRAAEIQARRMATAIRYRLCRRYAASASGKRLDLRKTIRTSLAQGGEPLRLVRQKRPLRPVRIVLFLDVSGSMQHYSRFFLQFIKGLVNEWIDTDAYVFHTRLIRVTDALREKDALTAMQRLSEKAEGFGGGTNLGVSLHTFNRDYARSAVNSRTAAFIFSDGYDSGRIERMSEELAMLKRRVKRLIWLNPLLGWENYRPVNGAMRAAIPHLDVFAAANTLAALAEIEPLLEQL